MKTAVAELTGVGPISFSRRYEDDVEEIEGESKLAFDQRTWRERLHYDRQTGECYIPGVMTKKALDWTAKQVGMKIKGRGIKTWASIFESGVICPDNVMLGVQKDDVEGLPLFVNSRGRKGGSLDVKRIFPVIYEWHGTVTFMILNDMIEEGIFREHLLKAGQFCGLGRYAPRNGGTNGRFAVQELLWHDEAVPKAA